MTDEQLLDIEPFLDTVSDDLDSLTNSQERLADIAVLWPLVLFSPNRGPSV